jgi:hypothetical protein
MKYVRLLIPFVLFAQLAQAQTVETDLVGLGLKPEVASYLAGILPSGSVLGNNTYLKGRNAANSADISVLKVDGSDETVLNADSGDSIVFAVAATPVAVLGASGFTTLPAAADITLTSGKNVRLAPYTVTAAATPAAGTNDVVVGYNIVPTAAANAGAILKATPSAGDTSIIFNSGPNAVRVKAGAGGTINGSTAGAYIPLATKQIAKCQNVDGTDWACSLSSVPTPAGP